MESLKGLTQEDFDALKAELFNLQIREKMFNENNQARIKQLLIILDDNE